MSGGSLAALLSSAIGVAVSPAPIVEFILVLFSRRRVPNAIAFVGTLIVMTVAAVLLGAAGQAAAGGSGGGTSRGAARADRLRRGAAAAGRAQLAQPARHQRAEGLQHELRHGPGGGRGRRGCGRMALTARAWLIAHNRLIMVIVLAVLGAVLLAKGVAAI